MKYLKYIFLILVSATFVFATDTPYCLNFSDWDDYVLIEDEPFKFSTRFTIECWFNIEEFVDSSALIDFSTYNIHEDYAFGYGVYVMDSSRIAVRLGNFTRTFEMIIDSLKTDIWYHFAVTYDKYKNDENIVAFLNGRVIKKADCNIYLAYPETFRPYGLVLGAFYDYPFLKAFKGSLDDVRFWSDVRTNEEILYNIDRPIDPQAQGLIAYYTFDQEADSLLLDSGPNSYHGGLENLSDSSWQLSYAHLAVEQPMDVSFDRVVLPWTSSHNFDSYCVDMSASKEFNTSIDGFPVSEVNTNYLAVDSIAPGTYYFRVKGHYDGEVLDTEPWTDIQIVETMTDAATAIKLSEFELSNANGAVVIDWITASQTENARFILEKKLEEGNWIAVYRTPGEGTTSKKVSYSFIDYNVMSGKTYSYRLKDISYSGIVSVSEEKKISLNELDQDLTFKLNKIYPNPFNPETRIHFEIYEDALVKINIYSLKGVLISEIVNDHMISGEYEMIWNPGQLSSGVYVLNISVNMSSISQKLLYLK